MKLVISLIAITIGIVVTATISLVSLIAGVMIGIMSQDKTETQTTTPVE